MTLGAGGASWTATLNGCHDIGIGADQMEEFLRCGRDLSIFLFLILCLLRKYLLFHLGGKRNVGGMLGGRMICSKAWRNENERGKSTYYYASPFGFCVPHSSSPAAISTTTTILFSLGTQATTIYLLPRLYSIFHLLLLVLHDNVYP